MKIRIGFVTNSSSSSFILSFDPKLRQGKEDGTRVLMKLIDKLLNYEIHSDYRGFGSESEFYQMKTDSDGSLLEALEHLGVDHNEELIEYYKGNADLPPDITGWQIEEEALVQQFAKELIAAFQKGHEVYVLRADRNEPSSQVLSILNGEDGPISVTQHWE